MICMHHNCPNFRKLGVFHEHKTSCIPAVVIIKPVSIMPKTDNGLQYLAGVHTLICNNESHL